MIKRAITGIQASGRQHLGNFLGVMQGLKQLQSQYQLFLFVADLHAITVDFEPTMLKDNNLQLVKTLLALGLDYGKVNLFLQSDLMEHTMLGYLMLTQSNLGELQRMTQFKTKKLAQKRNSNNTITIPTGLLTYPVLMAADILLYQPDIVPVGNDQKQHLELTNDLAKRVAKKFKLKLKLPVFIENKDTNRIMDLSNPLKKMSKSNPDQNGVIYLDDSKETIIKKVRKATTDSFNKIRFAKKTQPGVTNLLVILTALLKEEVNHNLSKKIGSDLVKYYQNKSYLDLKNDLSSAVINVIESLKFKKAQITDEMVLKVLNDGKNQAKKVADETLKMFYKAFGLTSNQLFD
ncbi:tryptophan--tRNA ligase [Mycoplasmoides genitalium]|uniref:Tryptophan--tRNA ligase n=1 Tax=Mycoplasma genitalium (strain ATCC 33530 / DSM 19775 / NCTC 10195 / G37) TaxID=243273 RepID=SYW_MYCGE|nr:tryptophan--tRNA ligase [Mycoplasmoides genitalium]P47372.1 RecName: Full=Tryptophan--tRNA ligase; AltName: Full=Tryptophanyl-tRNA synthetase; Short=TrpRS [Mycoplasmoides genitalium G37]AAC71344.1 tryptophanyl-tRNA synthetase [Mycoplasmoides genitalium G37]ABY79292.1 tryptophanyl-tRNA synthetase [synthetic Mycoplasma genitalium JCVI-1.0]